MVVIGIRQRVVMRVLDGREGDDEDTGSDEDEVMVETVVMARYADEGERVVMGIE